ncbi:hypothetical protein [Nocardia yamanashiensis]|uniref:hypothetical protein n=1 Tax=Nocardia yamanashiensis TaxID=209247 RepID=UPI0038CD6641
MQISDGGGKVSAARYPILGAAKVAQFVLGLQRKYLADTDFEVAAYNAQPAVLTRVGGPRRCLRDIRTHQKRSVT